MIYCSQSGVGGSFSHLYMQDVVLGYIMANAHAWIICCLRFIIIIIIGLNNYREGKFWHQRGHASLFQYLNSKFSSLTEQLFFIPKLFWDRVFYYPMIILGCGSY